MVKMITTEDGSVMTYQNTPMTHEADPEVILEALAFTLTDNSRLRSSLEEAAELRKQLVLQRKPLLDMATAPSAIVVALAGIGIGLALAEWVI